MATRNRTIGDVGLPFKEDPKKDVLFAKPTDPPGGNVTTEQQWQDLSTIDENRLNEISKDDADTYTGVLAPPNKGQKRKSGKETNDEWYSRMATENPDIINRVRESLGINRVRPEDIKRIRGGVELLEKGNGNGNANGTTPGGTGNVTTGISPNTANPNGIVDSANSQVSAVTSGVDRPGLDPYTKMLKEMDRIRARQSARLEDDEKRAKRNRLMSGIGDVLNAMHRAYSHSRGVNPMPGSERQMSKEWQDRYDRLRAERDKADYRNLESMLKVMNAKTQAERYAALAEYRRALADIKQKNADAKAEESKNKTDQGQQVTNATVEEKKAKTEKTKAETENIRSGKPANGGTPAKSSTGSKGRKKSTSGGKTTKQKTPGIVIGSGSNSGNGKKQVNGFGGGSSSSNGKKTITGFGTKK